MYSNFNTKGKSNSFQTIIFISITVFFGLMLCGCAQKKMDLSSYGISEPLTESHVITLSVKSESMDSEMPYIIYLPKGYGSGEKYPVWYGLNSHSTDESMWVDNGIVTAADELIESGEIEPIIMVFPYVKDATLKEIQKDLEDDGKFDECKIDQFIYQDLVPYIDSKFNTIKSAEGRYIGGFSLGGMISLRIAFHHTDMFSKVGGFSAAVLSSDYSDKQLEEWLFPNDNFDDIDDITEFDKKKGFDKLSVYLDAGKSNDPFIAGLQSLNDALQKKGIKSEFNLDEGGHTLKAYNIKDYLKFYAGTN